MTVKWLPGSIPAHWDGRHLDTENIWRFGKNISCSSKLWLNLTLTYFKIKKHFLYTCGSNISWPEVIDSDLMNRVVSHRTQLRQDRMVTSLQSCHKRIKARVTITRVTCHVSRVTCGPAGRQWATEEERRGVGRSNYTTATAEPQHHSPATTAPPQLRTSQLQPRHTGAAGCRAITVVRSGHWTRDTEHGMGHGYHTQLRAFRLSG